MITAQDIKSLRASTGAGIADVKRALEESGGDQEKASAWIERKLGSAAVKKASRATSAGLVEAYIHSNGKVGSLVEVLCETDFVARNESFKEFAHDLALHVAAMSPQYLSLDTVPADVWEQEKKRFEEGAQKLNKPESITGEIIAGKLKAYFGALALLSQPFVKDQNKTVGELVNESIGKFGENIKIGQFIRFEI